MAELEARLNEIVQSPRDGGLLEMIVCRPKAGERQIVDEGILDLVQGLIGDSWKARGSASTGDGSADPERQLTVMNSRVASLVARDKARWPLAGDQLYIDMDLSTENLPAGTRFELGSAIIEVTAPPHTGCKKFVARFGLDAMNFVNSTLGKQLRFRGINAKVVKAGRIRVGDVARKIIADG
jgi:hypothetical protein